MEYKKPFPKKRECRFCKNEIYVDYKNIDLLKNFVSERGKILPRRFTGSCAKHQRALSLEIKKARMIALLPFTLTK